MRDVARILSSVKNTRAKLRHWRRDGERTAERHFLRQARPRV